MKKFSTIRVLRSFCIMKENCGVRNLRQSFAVILLLGAFGSAGVPLAADQKWCLPDSPYKEVYQGSVANLRWSLFAISQLPPLPKGQELLLNGLTDASVISLANTLSLRAHYLRKCDLSSDEYFRELGYNQRFAALLLDVTSSSQFPAAERIAQKYPTLTLLSNPEDVMAALPPLHPLIVARLNLLKKDVEPSSTNPYFLATSQLLGENITWKERDVEATGIISMDTTSIFYKRPIDESVSLVRSKDPTAILWNLMHYYAKPTEPSKGMPAGLLH
jgi:hypothetical protein